MTFPLVMLRGMIPGGLGARLAVALALCGVLFISWWLTAGNNAAEVDLSRARTSSVEIRSIVQMVEATGRLEAKRPVVVAAGTQGLLREILVTSGQRVSKGEPLASLDDQPRELEVRALKAAHLAARAQVAEAEAGVKQLEVQLKRLERLASRAQSSQASVESARGELARANAQQRAARAEVAVAEAKLSSGQIALASTVVRAPIDGLVLRVPDKVGLSVGPQGPVLFEMAPSLDALGLVVDVGESEVGLIEEGQRARFEVPAYVTEEFKAEVTSIGVVAHMLGGLARYPVILNAQNVDGRLRPGMTASVQFEVAQADNVLAVRDAALRYTPPGIDRGPPRSRVFILRRGQVVAVSVQTGLTDGQYTEVRPASGQSLDEEDKVILGGLSVRQTSSSSFSLGGGG